MSAIGFMKDFDALTRGDGDWLRRLRAQGLSSFTRLGLPTRKIEAWKYTDVAALAGVNFELAALMPEIPLAHLPDLPAIEGIRLVFVNGRFRPDLSDMSSMPDGVLVSDLAGLLDDEADLLESRLDPPGTLPMVALNTAFLDDGLVLQVPEGRILDRPIHLISVGATGDRPLAFHPRHLILLEPGAAATVIETHVGTGAAPSFSNTVVQIEVARNATLRHCKVQDEPASAFHLATTLLRLDERAAYEGFVMQSGARLARNETHAVIAGTGATMTLNGATLAGDDRHLDNTVVVEHRAPGGRSRMLFKTVLDGHARGVFQGRVLVDRIAQKTDAYQLSRALLLSPGAEMDGKPELEIYADDVKCGHGAAVGALADEALFYLRSRGIDERTAQHILVEAFVAEALETVSPANVRDALTELVRVRLAAMEDGR